MWERIFERERIFCFHIDSSTENVFFVEIEHQMEKPVFRMLYQYYPKVLIGPREDSYHTYFAENMIVVQRLLSETPKAAQDSGSCCLEKLLVDLFSNKLTGKLIDRKEYSAIYEKAFQKYHINEKSCFGMQGGVIRKRR